ncbi:hypothetical protein O1611_g4419 [Lasiodiplodia mahajangana]|uniref:Uncharacterized protein n=1 Tax=Lasiodiplodia mahajangana TaxID=1108764 RepID=A0ACC2JNY7_9PEZI|nr:hypothetical protein O1611_g4419 [Lasiodiplodia mahajangana]
MKTSNIVSALLLAGVSSAQTPPGFTPAVTEKLEVTFGTKSIATGGQAMTRTETARQPTIGLSGPANGTYIWMLVGKLASIAPENGSSREYANNAAVDLDAYETPALLSVLRDRRTSRTLGPGNPRTTFTPFFVTLRPAAPPHPPG